MLGAMNPLLPKSAQVFHERALEYDGWFENSVLFDIELATLLGLSTPLASPRLEVGVGPGRFAEPLGVSVGIDPACAALSLARLRIGNVCQGVGENLPLQTSCIGSAFLLFTLCFTEHPQLVLREFWRVLKPKGHLVIGMVPRDSPWGESLRRKRQNGHVFYQHSHFYSVSHVTTWLSDARFKVVEQRSSLWQIPNEVKRMEQSKSGGHEDAGFVVLVGQKS